MTSSATKNLLKIAAKHNDDRYQFFVPPSESKQIYKYLRGYAQNDARTLLQTAYAIRKRRLEKGQLQVDLAYACDVAPGTLSQLENGRMFCTEDMAKRIAYGLRCKWTDLVSG